ncbi:hypothetical protein IGI04_006108, partial [Brassica rapa subsp. trilocularis]
DLNDKSYAFYWMFRKIFSLPPKTLLFIITEYFLASESIFSLEVSLSSTVADLKSDHGWIFLHIRPHKQLLLFSYIFSLQSSTGSDLLFGTSKHWAPLIWKETTPRHATTTWLFILNRNPTFDRLALWDAEMETICLQCGEWEESHDYLFFECSFSYKNIMFGCLTLVLTQELNWWFFKHDMLPLVNSSLIRLRGCMMDYLCLFESCEIYYIILMK